MKEGADAAETTGPAEGTEHPAGAGAPESVILADADDWIRSKLQGTTAQVAEYLRTPQIIVVGIIEDPAAGIEELAQRIMLEYGTHHLVATRNNEGRGHPHRLLP